MDELKMKPGKKKLIIVLILIAAVLAAILYIVKTHDTKPESVQEGQEMEDDVLKGDTIYTPAGELIIPEAWSDQVEMEDTSSDGTYSQSFYKTVGSQKVRAGKRSG